FSKEGKKMIGAISTAIGCISHRGPDGEGVFVGERVSLGHRRLSIIDTSTAANQPMYSADKRYCIVFNGEIFNYRELQSRFLSTETFTTTSDTEVFLSLFIKMGPACFSELRGFFAAGIYDSQKDELYIVRDRYGKKPVHVYRTDEVLLFASELKSLVAFGIPREINRSVLPYYFQLNYIPQPLSIFRNVQKLLPGHYLRVSPAGVEDKAYYELKVKKEEYGKISYEEAKTKLVELMDESTRLRLIADVPLGSFLSGGIDSSVVVAMAARYQRQLKTFSIGYKDHPYFDETAYAKLVAARYKTEHTVFSLGNQDFLEHIDKVLDYMDEPFADSSSIPTFILSHYTRKHVTVALSGDGGDEIFAGYNKYKAEWNMMQPSVKKNIVKGLSPLWKLLPKSRNNKITNTIRQLHRFAEGASLPARDRYWRWASMLPAAETRQLFAASFAQDMKDNKALHELYDWKISGEDLNEVLLADMNLVLTGDMLVKVDMMSMANSLEIRSPFLDQEVVAFAFGLPAEYKIDANMKKRIVQDAFRHLLPPELYNRPKQGFDIPLLDWFRKELWNKIDKDLLADGFIREQGIFEPRTIGLLKQKLRSPNPGDSHETIWALLVFQHWWKKYVAPSSISPLS
ncbi:MAG TPA: asparagine synthase (glutamine-hydrolyzing), partial [Flavisolibacter sp.]|nr:asparagine synthase (glutamine-hydrolyzing) [Flavisolibacter sp.]